MEGSSSGFWKKNCSSIRVPKLREEGRRERWGESRVDRWNGQTSQRYFVKEDLTEQIVD